MQAVLTFVCTNDPDRPKMVIRVEEAIVDAWSYADAYPQEITAAIRVNNELTIGYSIG